MNNKELTMEEIQQGSLRILIQIAQICKEQKLKYYLAYGTLIGAIRHKGFIPWDDDIDIWMPREDYQKLINYFIENEEELAPLELLSQYNKKDYPHGISRISNSEYYLDVDNEADYGLGLFVDIYPLDGVGNNEKEYTLRKKKASKYSSLCFLSTRKRFEIGTTKGFKKRLIKMPAFCLAHLMGKDYYLKKLDSIAKKNTYSESKYVGCLVWGTDGIKAIFPKEWFDGAVEVSFDNFSFLAPKEYDLVLTRLYGDYMKMPPEEKRISHHFYRAYRK